MTFVRLKRVNDDQLIVVVEHIIRVGWGPENATLHFVDGSDEIVPLKYIQKSLPDLWVTMSADLGDTNRNG